VYRHANDCSNSAVHARRITSAGHDTDAAFLRCRGASVTHGVGDSV
jgi:hypothetical protein